MKLAMHVSMMEDDDDNSSTEKAGSDLKPTELGKSCKKSMSCETKQFEIEMLKNHEYISHEFKSKECNDKEAILTFPYEPHMNHTVTVEIQEDSSAEEIVISTDESITIEQDQDMMKFPFQVKHEIDNMPLIHEIFNPDSSHANVLGILPGTRGKTILKSHTVVNSLQIKQEVEDELLNGRAVVQSYPSDHSANVQTELLNTKYNLESETSQNKADGKPPRPRRQPKHKCEGCNQEFSHRRTLEAHGRECGKPVRIRRTQCIHPSCTKEFFHKFRMIEHYKTDHEEKAEEEQEQEVADGPEMKTHPNFLNPEYICCNCERVFIHLPELSAHERVCGITQDLQSQEKYKLKESLSCLYPSCRRQFTQKTLLTRHVRREHTKIKREAVTNYSCPNCFHTFAYRSAYMVHAKACGQSSKVRKTPCIDPQCKREFFHKCRLIQHVEYDHPDIKYTESAEKSIFKCTKCDQEYAHERSLKSHSKLCGRKGRLNRTKCLHSSCSKEFYHRTRMMQHMKKEHPDFKESEPGDGPGFRCQKCNTTYGHKQSLQRHLENCSSGSKLRNTQCLYPTCPKRFFHISSMVKHMENDHTDMEIKIIEKHFLSLTDFKLWKEDEETKSFSYFSTRHSITLNSGKSYLCFVCQYNGPDRNQDAPGDPANSPAKRWRQGKIRTGLVCPARMLVKENIDGSVTVKYVQTHSHKVSQDSSAFPPMGKRTFRKYQLAMKEADQRTETMGMVGEVISGDALDTLEVSVKEDAASGEMIAEAVMGTGYFDYMVKPNCGYVHTLEKANQTIKLFQQRTSSRFICYKVQRSFGKEGWSWEKRKVLWQQEELRENTLPEFDGVPYILNGTKVLECEYGVNRSAYHRTTAYHRSVSTTFHHTSAGDPKRILDQEGVEKNSVVEAVTEEPLGPITKKVNCPAKIFLKDVIKFPEFKVEANSRQEKRIKSNLLRLALRDGRARGERRVYIQLSRDSDHCDHHPVNPVRQRKLPHDGVHPSQTSPLLPHPYWDTQHLSDSTFLQHFRITRPLFQFLVTEWRKEGTRNDRTENSDLRDERMVTGDGRRDGVEAEHRTGQRHKIELRSGTRDRSAARDGRDTSNLTVKRTRDEATVDDIRGMRERVETETKKRAVAETGGMVETVPVLETLDGEALAALYYLGSLDPIASASNRFQVKTNRFLEAVMKFAEFLVQEGDKYIQWPQVEERVQAAEIIQRDCGFPGVFGALDAALVHIHPSQAAVADIQNYTYSMLGQEVDGEDDGVGDRSEVGQVKCALVLQFIADHKLTFRDIHLDAPKTGTRMQVFQESSAWVAVQQMMSAESHLVGPVVYPLAPALMTPHVSPVLSYQEALYNQQHQEAHRLAANAMTVLKSRFRRLQLLEGTIETCATLLRAACILHNIALAREEETVLHELVLEYNSAEDEEGWHTVGMEEVVAEIGVLGGEEKRHYLTTIMTPR